MIRRPPRSTRTDTLFPYTTLFRSEPGGLGIHVTLDLAGHARFGPDVQWIDELDYTLDEGRAARFYPAIRHYWPGLRSEEHTSELQSLMRISYAVFCLKKKKNRHQSTRLMYPQNTTSVQHTHK